MRDNRRDADPDRFDPSRPRANGTNGARLDGMRTNPVPFDDMQEPVDLVAVQADDELINALASGMSVSAPGIGGYDADDRVAAILAAWKADVDAEPIPELVDLDTAVSVVLAARPPSRKARHLAPLAAAAAFIVLAIGGVSVGSYSAEPDDALWGVSKVLFSERAESVQAAARVEEHIAKAKEALIAGQPVLAARELAAAESDLAVIRPQEGKAELAETQDFLVAKAAETPPGTPTNPGAPLVTEPSRKVPSGATVAPEPSQREKEAAEPVEPGQDVAPAGPGDPSRPAADPRNEPDPQMMRNEPADPGPSAGTEPTDPGPTPTSPPGGTDEGTEDPSTGGPTPSATNEGQPATTTTEPSQGMGETPSAGVTTPS